VEKFAVEKLNWYRSNSSRIDPSWRTAIGGANLLGIQRWRSNVVRGNSLCMPLKPFLIH